jgi:large subunit ribosomal protein L20
MRETWITRIGGASREAGTNYSTLMNDCVEADIVLNRKVISELAIHEPKSFKALATHGARFSTEIYTRGCHWIPRLFA